MKALLSRKYLPILFILTSLFYRSFCLEWEGKFKYAFVPAPALKNSKSVQEGLHSSKFLEQLGGMIFDQIAAPAEGLKVESLSILYAPEKEDGKRLNLILNGNKVEVLLYDWQLAPIARYADTPFTSCLSPSGGLNDKNLEKKILEARGMIINYHPAFENTLLGLRLFLMYNLILYNHSILLPKVQGSYLLGKGETPPDVDANKKGFINFANLYKTLNKEMNQVPRAVVISDFSRTLSFSVRDNVLEIGGTPYFFFWRYQSDQPEYNPASVVDACKEEINREKSRNPLFDERRWMVTAILKLSGDYRQNYSFQFTSPAANLVQLKSDAEKQAFLERLDSDALFNLFATMKERMEAHRVSHLERYSQVISNQTDILRSINPLVWDAALNTMRYAAFFRYCKNKFPDQWKHFMETIKDVSVKPGAETPTVMYPSDNSALEQQLRNP